MIPAGLKIDKALGFVVNRTAYILYKRLAARFGKRHVEVTPAEWALLNRLWERDGQHPGELAESTIRDRTTTTRILDSMEKKGLIVRKLDRQDRRLMLVSMTSKGRKLETVLPPIAQEVLQEATAGISQRDLEVTFRTLRRIQDNLVAEESEEGT